MTIETSSMTAQEIEPVRQLLASNRWAHRVADSTSFELLINNSDCCIVALKNNAVVGFARGITDHLSNGYISMVVVASEC